MLGVERRRRLLCATERGMGGVAMLALGACSSPSGEPGHTSWLGSVSLAIEGNSPPAAPIIREPEVGRVFNPGNVHMETDPFSDPDSGDEQLCTDWEIWSVQPRERVWVTPCVGAPLMLHTHLGDGVFEGALQRRHQLLPSEQYLLRVRHRDNSGASETEWSEWSERAFETGALTQVFPMLLSGLADSSLPRWTSASTDLDLVLPASPTPAEMRLEDAAGGALLAVTGTAAGNHVSIPPPRTEHVAVRLMLRAGQAPLHLQESNLTFSAEDGSRRTVYLPRADLAPNSAKALWIADNGGTYSASTELAPVFDRVEREADVPWTVPADFRADVVAKGFNLPVGIAFIPEPGEAETDPLYYVVELYGSVKVVRRNGVVSEYATGILNYEPSNVFPGSGEQGLGSAAVDPLSGDLLVTMVYSSDPDVPGAPLFGAVDRFVSVDGGITASARYRVLNMEPELQAPAHQVSNITFGPDGYVYVHSGDGLVPAAAQDLDSFRGKVLRMTRTGAAVSTNPYFNAADGISARDYVYAFGLRNAWGGAWRTSDRAQYFVENGPSVDRLARLNVARNYGWDGSDQSMYKFAIYNWNPATSPVNIAFLQASAFGRSGFPASYEGRAYVTEFCCGVGPGWSSGKVITEWEIGDDERLKEGRRAVAIYNGSGAATPVALAAGPDGLYFSDLFGESLGEVGQSMGKIIRLRHRAEESAATVSETRLPAAEPGGDGQASQIGDDPHDAAHASACDEGTSGGASLPLSFDFAQPDSLVTLNGAAEWIDGAVRLTPAAGGLLGSAIFTPASTAPLAGFRAQFELRMGGGSGADGISFAVFDAALHSQDVLFGESGPGPGALAVVFNTYDNGDGANNVQVWLNGDLLGTFASSCRLNSGEPRTANIRLVEQTLDVMLACAPGEFETLVDSLAVPTFVPFVAGWGFGARTGGLADEHWIDDVTFWSSGDAGTPSAGHEHGCGDQ